MAALTRTVAPTSEPLTAADVRGHLKIPDTETRQDPQLEGFIADAREEVENKTNRQLITAKWTLYLDVFPAEILVPRPPLQSITSLQYYDTAGVLQSLTEGTDFQVDSDSEPARIWPEPSMTWPSTESGRTNAVILIFTAGYGDDAEDVPERLRHVMRLIVGMDDVAREAIVFGDTVREIGPMRIADILAEYRVDVFANTLLEQ